VGKKSGILGYFCPVHERLVRGRIKAEIDWAAQLVQPPAPPRAPSGLSEKDTAAVNTIRQAIQRRKNPNK
jgi:hypothetical protein